VEGTSSVTSESGLMRLAPNDRFVEEIEFSIVSAKKEN
jgi:hypothetical protein